jgi:hypothetical protein
MYAVYRYAEAVIHDVITSVSSNPFFTYNGKMKDLKLLNFGIPQQQVNKSLIQCLNVNYGEGHERASSYLFVYRVYSASIVNSLMRICEVSNNQAVEAPLNQFLLHK